MKTIFKRFLFIIDIPIVVILWLESCKHYLQEDYICAMFDVIYGIFILIEWVKEVFNKR